MRDHFKTIYSDRAADYDALVSREDYEGNLLPAIQAACPLQAATVVEIGAGTGRLTRLLVPQVERIYVFDGAPAMLAQARQTLPKSGQNWYLGVADNRSLPLPGQMADLVISGWSLGHATGWYPDSWRAGIRTMLRSMLRIVKSSGVVMILETMGTAVNQPGPPTPALATYYDMLVSEFGFQHQTIPTHFQFESLDEAERLMRFFFGDETGDRIRTEGNTIIPEYTGIWWRQA